jgi:anti-sigma factor RsiW
MTCTDFEPNILLAGSGELPATRHKALNEHLAHCPKCRAFQADIETVMELTRKSLTALPEGPAEPVMRRIREASERRHDSKGVSTRGAYRLLAMAAGLTLLFGTGYAVHRAHDAPSSADLRTVRIAECSSWLVALLEMENNSVENTASTQIHFDLQSLARQLLILQDMNFELPEDLADSATPPEALRPTTLQWRSTRATTSQKCG